MALTPNTLVRIVRGPSAACALWSYTNADDSLATIVTANYFDSQAGKLRLNDIIFATGSDGHETYRVTARTSTAVTIVAFS
jgi:hypothetical protein